MQEISRTEREILSPSALVRQARDVIEQHFGLIWVEGEISNLARPASGHVYFSLKDAQAQVRCAMFRPRSSLLRFRPADGMHVLARARVSLYEARGEFQLLVEHLEESGEGALLREFEQLKARLAAAGLFDARLKRALPRLPRRIGIITSPTGAAVRDILSVIARRFPLVEIDVLPSLVQGSQAAAAIAAMLQRAASSARYDVLVLTRGGGSLEDLWAFNDEALAHAIRASSVPVVSAIGHEIDFTIADFAADLRAATPSAAGELLVPDVGEMRRTVTTAGKHLVQTCRRRLQSLAQRGDLAIAGLRNQHPRARLQRYRERLSATRARIHLATRTRLATLQHRVGAIRPRVLARISADLIGRFAERLRNLRGTLRNAGARRLDTDSHRLAELARALHTVSPLATLERGYAILTELETGCIIRAPQQAPAGTALRARVAEGEFIVRSEHVQTPS